MKLMYESIHSAMILNECKQISGVAMQRERIHDLSVGQSGVFSAGIRTREVESL